MKPKRSTAQKTTKTPSPPKTPCSDPTPPASICLWVTNENVCREKCESPSDLLFHIESMHAPHGLVCFWQDCPKKQHVYSETRNFRNHLTDHTGEKSYECKVCHLKLSRSGLAKHRNNVHPIQGTIDPENKSSPTPATKCLWEKDGEKCSYDCQDPADLIEHIDSDHIDSTQICYWKGCRQLLKPIFANSLERKKSVLHDEKAFLNHVRSHTGYQPYKCQHCPKTFAMEYKLVEHLRSDHPEPVSEDGKPHFYCDWEDGTDCHFAGATAVELTNHITSFHGKKANDFVCRWENCDLKLKPFNSKRDLICHFRVQHNKKDRPYECPVCHWKCSLKKNLDNHMREAHPEATPEIRCYWMGSFSMCTQICKNPTELAEHIETVHSEDIKKSVVCRWDGCWMEFQQKRKFITHLLRHTGEKTHECDLCHEKFTRHGLGNHYRSEHKDHKRKPGRKRAAQISNDDSEDNENHEEPAKRHQKVLKKAQALSATAPTNHASDQHAFECTQQQIGAYTDGYMPTQQPTSADAPQDPNYAVNDTQLAYAQYSSYEEENHDWLTEEAGGVPTDYGF